MFLMSKSILITGTPGVGKTTLALRVVEVIRSKGYGVGGIITQEIKENESRVGFELLDLYTGSRGILARVDLRGPRVGKYGVDLRNLEQIGVASILNAIRRRDVDILVVDEIGPMELSCPQFAVALKEAIRSCKPFLGTIQFKLRDKIFDILGSNEIPQIIELTHRDRDRLIKVVLDMVLKILESRNESAIRTFQP
jgi:nucleoside-triphosphatase